MTLLFFVLLALFAILALLTAASLYYEDTFVYYFNKIFKVPLFFKPKYKIVTHPATDFLSQRYSFTFRNWLGFKVTLPNHKRSELVRGCYIYDNSTFFIDNQQKALRFIEA